jgi:methionyl-tRNA formyltransferase
VLSAARSLVLFGDTVGLPRLLKLLDPSLVRALVRAEVRPEQEPDLARLAAEWELRLLVQPRRSDSAFPDFARAIRELAPDLILVDSYSMLLPPEILRLPPMGGVNVHGALLPRHRGANPIQWAILNDERRAGVTIHQMTEEIDAGAIIAQREVPIEFGDTWRDVYARISEATESLLAEELPLLLSGMASVTPQTPAEAHTNSRRTREDGRFEWSRSVLEIYNLVRALVSPLPGAFYEAGGREVVLDEFLTISQVASLKYGHAGGAALSAEGLALEPVPDARRSDVIEFRAVQGGEPCVVGSLRVNWAGSRTAETLLAVEGDRAEIAARLIEQFAASELELEAVRVAHPGSGST